MTSFVTGRDAKAEELLYLLNNQQPVPLSDIEFLVIVGTYTPSQNEPQDWPFARGEIIAATLEPDVWDGKTMVHCGQWREVFGQKRYLGTWDMSNVCQQAESMDDALEIAALAKAGKDGYYEHAFGGWRLITDQAAGRRMWAGAADSYMRIGDATADRW